MYLLIHIEQSILLRSCTYLHPTMYLLIPSYELTPKCPHMHLHPTMYLLIHKPAFRLYTLDYIYIPLCIY